MYAKNLEVQNLFYRTEEDLVQVALQLAALLGVRMAAEEIDSCVRLPYGPKPVVVVFKDKQRRDEVFRARGRNHYVKWRELAEALDVPLQEGEAEDERVYVNQHLTSYFRRLLRLAKNICSRLDIKYCWYNNNRVMIRYPEDSSTVMVIETMDDLQQLSRYGPRMQNVVQNELANERALQIKFADKRGFQVQAPKAVGGANNRCWGSEK